MRIRGFLLTSAAVSGLLFASSALLPKAYAQKGNLMTPSTGWAVNQVNGKSGGYCAVARHFDGNTILTLARNQASETSFALDFPQLKFKPSKSMAVTLDPGAGLQREYDIKPLSQKAFVVRLGEDTAFFDALDRTGQLRVEAAGESYVFNISDIDAGESQLRGCLASFEAPVKAKSPVGATAAAVPSVEKSSNSFLPEPVGRQASAKQDVVKPVDLSGGLSGNDATLRAENLRLRAALQTEEAVAAKPTRKVTASGGELSALKRQLEQAKSENAKLMRKLDGIEKQASRPSGASKAEVRAQQEKLSALRSENISLQARVQNLNQSLQGYKGVDASDRAWKEEKVSLRDALKQEQEKNARAESRFEAKLSGLSERNSRLVETIKSAKDAIGDLAQIRSSLQAKSVENEALKTALVEQDSAVVAAKQDQIETLSQEKESAVAEAAAIKQELVALKSGNQQQSKQLAQAELQLLELSSLKDANESLQTKLSSFVQKFTENKEQLQLSQSGLETRNLEILAENEALKAERSSLKDALQLAQASFAEKADGFKAQLAEKASEILKLTSLQTDLEAAKSDLQLVQAEKARLQDNVSALQGDLEVARSEVSGAQEQELVISALEVENVELRNSLQETEAAASEEAVKVVGIEIQNFELRGFLQKAIAKIEGLKAGAEESSLQLAALEKENKALNGQLEFASSLIGDTEPAAGISDEQEVASKAVSTAASAREVAAITVAMALSAPKAPKPASKPVKEKPAAKAVKAKAVVDDAYKPTEYKPTVVQQEVAEVSVAESLAGITPAAGEEEAESIVEPQVESEPIVETTSDVQATSAEFMERNLSEAQIYEEQLKRKLENEQSVVEAAPVEVSISEDPFEPIEAQSSPDVVELAGPVVAKVTELRKDVAAVPEIPSADALETTPQLSEVDKTLAPVKETVSKVVATKPVVSSVASTPIADVLGAANVAAPADVRKVDAASGANITAYQWRAGEAYGSGEQKALPNGGAFDEYMKEYLSRTEKRCKGDFAIVPDNSRENGSQRVDSYEVACIGEGISSGAALVFYNDGGTFNVVAHEVDAQNMEQAMQIRDKVFATLTDGSRS